MSLTRKKKSQSKKFELPKYFECWQGEEINWLLGQIWAFCNECCYRKSYSCNGYEPDMVEQTGKPACELLEVFRKYKFRFTKGG